jgi:hypothetical protein
MNTEAYLPKFTILNEPEANYFWKVKIDDGPLQGLVVEYTRIVSVPEPIGDSGNAFKYDFDINVVEGVDTDTSLEHDEGVLGIILLNILAFNIEEYPAANGLEIPVMGASEDNDGE